MNDTYLLKKGIGQTALEAAYTSVYPNKCLFCRKVLDNLCVIACEKCEKSAALGHDIGDGTFANIGNVHIAYSYDEEAVRYAVMRFKYEGKRLLVRAMAQGIFERVGELDEGFADFLVCVPLHENRLKERGYNQSALLAAELSRLYGLPAYDGMLRTRDTAKQFELSPAERAANVAGAFALKEGFDIVGKSVLLVDDILTTGATAMECAKVLMEAGAGSVGLMVFSAAICSGWGGLVD